MKISKENYVIFKEKYRDMHFLNKFHLQISFRISYIATSISSAVLDIEVS